MLVLFILYHYISTLNGPSESTVYYWSGTAWQRIQGYRALLAEYHVKDEAVQARLRRPLRRERVRRSWEAVVGVPLNLRGRQEGGEIIPTHDLLLDQQLGQ